MANAKRLAQLMHSKPFTPQQRVVEYVEFAAEFGPISNIDPYGRKLNFIQYFMLDIFVPLICLLILLAYFIYRLCSMVFAKLAAMFRKISKRNKLE